MDMQFLGEVPRFVEMEEEHIIGRPRMGRHQLGQPRVIQLASHPKKTSKIQEAVGLQESRIEPQRERESERETEGRN